LGGLLYARAQPLPFITDAVSYFFSCLKITVPYAMAFNFVHPALAIFGLWVLRICAKFSGGRRMRAWVAWVSTWRVMARAARSSGGAWGWLAAVSGRDHPVMDLGVEESEADTVGCELIAVGVRETADESSQAPSA
jgi:hypothetical protein